jgi:di/tripeptidase
VLAALRRVDEDRAASGQAVIGDRAGGLDMLSIGSQIEAPHSPDERVSIPTVARFWRLLAGVVDDLSTV